MKHMKMRRMATLACGILSIAIVSINAHAYEHGMTMITPSDQWREALPSGNGMIGALVYGSISKERVLFNHNELWYGGTIADLPDISAELPVVRKLLSEGKYLDANFHYTQKLKDKGFRSRNGVYHPAFDMLLSTETVAMFEDYSRTLDFETGEVEVKWRDGDTHFSRRLFVSIPDDISVMSIKADRKKSVSGEVTLDIHDLNDAIEGNGRPLPDTGFTFETTADDEYIEFRADGTDGGEFGGVLRVVAKKGDVTTANGHTQLIGKRPRGTKTHGYVTFEGADEVTLIVGFYANEQGKVAVPRLKAKLAKLSGDYDSLFKRHQPLHSKKFNSMGVNINYTGKNDTPNEYLLLDAYQNPASIELTQKLFDYGRYLLVSSSRAGGYPVGLQGIWNGDYRPPWAGLYGINENLQMSYWQGLPGNMEESMMAFYDHFDALMDDFRHNAKQLYGCRGIYIPPFMSPESGKLRLSAPHVIYWTDAAGWLASFYYDYYLFTGDEKFLKERAIPFMKEVALFYEDYIVKDEKGVNMLFPSQSPENSPQDKTVIDPKSGRETKIKVQINSTIAVAISKEVLTNLIASCEVLGVEKDGVKRWKALLADMPEYQINKDGAMCEWLHPDFKDNYEHRHMSHVYPLFPGHEITAESNPALYEACKVAIDKRLTVGLSSQTGWSLAHMANVWARLGEGEKAEETLGILSRVCLSKNLFTYHNDWRKMGVTLDFKVGRTSPFQMDANFGIPAAIMEMLCGSNANMLRILPALPASWKEGGFDNMLTRAGVKTSVKWDMKKKMVDIALVAQRDAAFDIQFPDEFASIKSAQADTLKKSKYGDNYRKATLKSGQAMDIKVKMK